MKRRPLILITNDDGIDAAGIRHLRRSLDRVGETVVFAPKSEKSGASTPSPCASRWRWCGGTGGRRRSTAHPPTA